MSRIKQLINKYKEFISYGFWGCVTTLLNLLLYLILIKLGMPYTLSNIITLITIKTLCYFVNKILVFKTKCMNKKELSKEVIKYILSRLFTMALDYFGVILFVEVFEIDKIISKAVILVVVVLVNYLICKKYVYKNI
ncbi:MAG: GtrA family protein [Bacilli bacterium]|nr:GtrA family protein [Bacilli bacterium]